MFDNIDNVALIGLLVVYITDRVLVHLRSRGIDLKTLCEKTIQTHGRVVELHEWHNHDKEGQPGVKIWYGSTQQDNMLERMTGCLEQQTDLMCTMHEQQLLCRQNVTELRNDVHELRK